LIARMAFVVDIVAWENGESERAEVRLLYFDHTTAWSARSLTLRGSLSYVPVLSLVPGITELTGQEQARIKKLIQADEDVGKVAQATPVVLCAYLSH
jgi:hypothetical protein